MHNVNVAAVEETATRAEIDPDLSRQALRVSGEWQIEGDGPQFRGTIPYPTGEVEFLCDFPPQMGGNGVAPNPLAYCLWGGLACYAMTYATEAAREGIELKGLRATVETEVDQARALGISDRPPVEQIIWTLEVEADADRTTLDRLKAKADERCPGVYCVRNPVPLQTRLAEPAHAASAP